jgi:hypothetical protein
MGAPEIAAFLTWLAVDRQVSASTQNQALSALLFSLQGRTGDRHRAGAARCAGSNAGTITCRAQS